MDINNYTLIESKYLELEQSHAYVLEHNRTKAKVFIMQNDDDNKLFSIGFRTPPFDSSGVCHILEHCVLNGSKKYRTREPFMDMVKSSLQTFLNAMTFSDKTLYPVASRNNKDFENLMDVYLDAVFNPIVKEKKEIFLQEGWRYNLDEDDNLTYKGVVYNEMKGGMSSPEQQVFDQIYKHLYPDTIYSLNSGGDPYEIPNLTYEKFLDFYNEFYHPSNAYIFLYGDMDYEKYLSYIDQEYLSNYDYRQVNSELGLQAPFSESKQLVDYFSTTKEVKDNSNMISYSVVTSDCNTAYDRLMNELLYALINSDSSPIKTAINELEIVDDIINVSSSNKQLTFSILGKNIAEKDTDLFVNTIENTLNDMVQNGIDEDLFRSMLNIIKFAIKEKGGKATKGIEYLYRIFDTWLYDMSPIDSLDISETIEYIEENISNGIFEKYIKEKIIDNKHKLIVLHKPKFALNEEKDKQIEQDHKDKLASMSQAEKDELHEQREQMDYFQNRQDTDEEKATIPTLNIEDVNSKFSPVDRTVIDKDSYIYLTHNLPTSGIDYVSMVFDINHISKEDILYTVFLADVLGMLNTKNYDYQSLFTKTYLETGGIYFNVGSHTKVDTGKFNRTLTMTTKLFSENVTQALNLIKEILFNTQFDNEKRIKELINVVYSRMEMNLLGSAHQLVLNRSLASKYVQNDFSEKIDGVDAYLFYKELSKADFKQVLEKLEDMYKKVFNKNNLVINITSDFTNKDQLLQEMDKLVEKLNDEITQEATYDFEETTRKEALITSTDVSYASVGNNLANYDYSYQGSSVVISNIVSNAYLYNEIRAKGGAYGAGMHINNLNGFATFSYRDPNIKKTIDTYLAIPDFMNKLELQDSDLNSYIIGAIGKFDPAMTERAKGNRDLDMYLTGRDYSYFEEKVEEAKNTSKEDILSLAKVLGSALPDTTLTVLTSKSKYEENKELFDTIINLA